MNKNILIFIFASLAGLSAGYLIVFGVKTISPSIQSLVSNIDFSKDDDSQGGPSSEKLFKDKAGEDVYFLDYEKSYKISGGAPVPYLTADSYLVGDIETGEIILSKNEDKPLPIASISKLMTAIVADDTVGLSTKLRVSEKAINTYGRQGNLSAGEEYFISDILYPLILESSNDAAEAVAEAYGRDDFLRSMNEKSREIEMYNTHFGDPSGLSPLNVSSVNDLFKLSQYVENYRNYIFKIARTKTHELGEKIWFSNSKFRSDDDYYGGKNGYTDIAQKTQLAVFEIDFKDEKRKIAFIVLKTDDIEGDIYGLKRYVERHVSYH